MDIGQWFYDDFWICKRRPADKPRKKKSYREVGHWEGT